MLLLTASTFAQTDSESVNPQRISFYFQGETNLLDGKSRNAVLEFYKRKDKSRIQISEINTFCNVFKSEEKNIRTAQERIGILMKELEMPTTALKTVYVENFGGDKSEVEFEPKNWNRIDMYYSVLNLQKYSDKFVAYRSDTLKINKRKKLTTTLNQPQKKEEVKKGKKSLTFNSPRELSVRFVPKKAKVIESSFPSLNYLTQLLMENPSATVHLRGHVCCEPNMKLSTKRVKTIAKYLVKKGVQKDRISYRGYSNALPVVAIERTERDRIRNERIEVVFREKK